MRRPDSTWLIVIAALLIGASLRFYGIDRMSSVVLYDEAAYAVDALSLLHQPRLTPYFPANFGREGLWMYVLAPALAVFGAEPFTLRLLAAFTGVLTLAAVFALSREIFGRRGAAWATLALAVLYWHAHLSHIGFRALLFPLVGALAFAALLRAYRRGTMSRWIVAGVLLGLLVYTYIAARLWLALGVALLLLWSVTDRKRRSGALSALLACGMVSAPMLIYALMEPAAFSARADDLTLDGPGALLANVYDWLLAWLHRGEAYLVHNAPLRPILDAPLALLTLAGLAGMAHIVKRRWFVLLIFALWSAALLPSVLSAGQTNMLRAIGAVVPLALVVGAGALTFEKLRLPRHTASLLVLVLLLWSGVNTLTGFDRSASAFNAFLPQERHLLAAVDALPRDVPADTPVYFMPLQHDYPLLAFKAGALVDWPVAAFHPGYCTVYADAPLSYYVELPPLADYVPDQLAAYAQVIPLREHGYRLYTAQPDTALFAGWDDAVDFGGAVALRLLEPLPAVVDHGDQLRVTVAVRAAAALPDDLRLFVHLYGDPAPYEGGTLWDVDERLLCEPYPSSQWRSDEVIVQTYILWVSGGMSAGHYTIAAGVVDHTTGALLATGTPHDVVTLHTLSLAD